jgi:ABC-type bacteriocin/lantibiotic exporter with double-glycine peptidase domain
MVLLMTWTPIRVFLPLSALRNRCAAMVARWEPLSGARRSIMRASPGNTFAFQQVFNHMDNLSGYANRPFPFVLRYLRRRLASHVVIIASVIAAVVCSVSTQYGVKYLVDGLSAGPTRAGSVWLAFVLLMSLIAADNFLWRIASWTASFTFVGVTGDLRRDIFRHLTGHAPSYFSDRLPGMLTSRITATSNAIFSVENMFVWNVLPPCIATVTAIVLIGTVSLPMSAGLIVIGGGMVVAMFRLAAAGKPLHDDFADKAAAVDGEMVDVINNMPLVRAFCGLSFEHDRFDATVNREVTARGRSLRYLEKLRLTHAAVTVVLTIALLAWAIMLWQRGGATTGDVGPFHPERNARSRRGASRCHPACCPVDRSDRHAAASARAARPPRGRAARQKRRGDCFQQYLVPLSRRT